MHFEGGSEGFQGLSDVSHVGLQGFRPKQLSNVVSTRRRPRSKFCRQAKVNAQLGALNLGCCLEMQALFLPWSNSSLNNFTKSYLLDSMRVNHDCYLPLLFILKSITLNLCMGRSREKSSTPCV